MADFTPVRAFSTEGARIGLMSCLECGAALVVDPGDTTGQDGRLLDVAALHVDWHERERLARKGRSASDG